jgi:hypothetical protein
MQAFSEFAFEVNSPSFEIPNFEIDFSTFLEVTTEGADRNIYLSRRGDGVQTKFIPQILDGISRNQRLDFVIWGFEEPENSLEYKNIRQLASTLEDEHCKNKQIFITSHSFTFTSLKGDNTSHYRVYKNSFEEGTRVALLRLTAQGRLFPDKESDEVKLEEELGIVELNSDLEALYERRAIEITKTIDARVALELEMKPILVVEDENNEIYKVAWLKINNIPFNAADMEDVFNNQAPFVIESVNGAGGVSGFLRQENVNGIWQNKRVCGLYDFDKEGTENFYNVKKGTHWDAEILGSKREGLYKKRNQHPCFYALLIPVPERLEKLADINHANFSSFVEIENLLPEEFLFGGNYVEEKEIVGVKYFKMKDDKKPSLWKAIIDIDTESLTDFVPLYVIIYKLLGISS